VVPTWSVQSSYKEELQSWQEQHRTESNFETPAWQDMGLGTEE
jgi:hypothetical protein